ncbi:MAG TPA: anthranilate phosphoribosyltransferase [Pyrinomonadaceae bacterium]|nr:anthranilate phosphoribosyltransferase [Pyrinomonadaceae bacterium]
MDSLLNNFVDTFRSKRDLAIDDADRLLDAMITSSDEALLASLFEAWNGKGISEDEIYEIARVMRERCTKITTRHERFVDVVGTGGSKVKTFNISTAAALVVAGAGVAVAKHGNKAATSSTGSADVLAALGVEPAVDAETAARCLDQVGICFMFAPKFHRLSPTLAKVRRGLGFPTIFNCVGPLCNPASAPHQLIGVWDKELVPKMANALSRLGTKKSWVVHGSDGLDEISLSAPTFVAEVENGVVNEFEILPGDYNMPRDQNLSRVRVTNAAESAAIIQDVLAADRISQPEENVVLLNAAAAIYLAGGAGSFREGLTRAGNCINNCKGLAKLWELKEATRK